MGRGRRHRREPRPLYIGGWIRALGYRPADVARACALNEGYLSQLISGHKKNPSRAVLETIAEYLDVPVEYLGRKPPEKELAVQIGEVDFNTLQRIAKVTRPQ